MSELKVISAREFRKKATRIIEIDGFEPGEKIAVRIKPASLLNLMMGGKLPNNLLGTVNDLFEQTNKGQSMQIFEQDDNRIKDIMEIIDLVCEQSLVEPTYEEIKEVITDTKKMQIKAEAQGNVNAAIPSIPK